MKSFNTLAIILGNKNFGENHKLIFLYSKDLGKIKAIAKGARKITSKFSGHLETLNIVEAQLYFGPKNILITEINTLKSFSGKSQKDLDKIEHGLQIAEVTHKLIYENQSFDNLMELLEKTLDQINISQKSTLITQSYIIKLLDKIGHIPDFKKLNSKIEKKYLKFFNFIQKENFLEIEKICLSPSEEQTIKNITFKLLENATN